MIQDKVKNQNQQINGAVCLSQTGTPINNA